MSTRTKRHSLYEIRNCISEETEDKTYQKFLRLASLQAFQSANKTKKVN